jgi:hypothetical protein
MLHQFRFVSLGLGVASSLVSVRALTAQTTLRIDSVNVQGVFESSARCQGREDTPDALVVHHTDTSPLSATLLASASDTNSLSRARAGLTLNILQSSDGALQISGSGIVSTFGSISGRKSPGGDPFAMGAARADAVVELDVLVTRWANLSFAGTLSIGTVTAVGSPQFSSVDFTQAWLLLDNAGNEIVRHDLSLTSNDPETQRQETHYSSVVARPGMYRLRVCLLGNAGGELRQAGATGWTSAGSFGLAVSASPVCIADIDQNGVLDSRDFFEFMNAFLLEAIDFNADAAVDSRDFFDFMNAFLAGCA